MAKIFRVTIDIDVRKNIRYGTRASVEATKNRQPVELIYYEACQTEKAALEREKYFKTGFGREFLRKRLGEK